jgi:hypothetical protein
MRTITTLALVLSLASTASASPRHRGAAKASREAALKVCVHERTGPTGGITVAEATKLCRLEAKVRAAQAKAKAVIAACEQAVADLCVETAAPDGSTDCMAPALYAACYAGDPELEITAAAQASTTK